MSRDEFTDSLGRPNSAGFTEPKRNPADDGGWPKKAAARQGVIAHPDTSEQERRDALEARIEALENVLYRNGLSKYAVPLSEAEKAASLASRTAGFEKIIADREHELIEAKAHAEQVDMGRRKEVEHLWARLTESEHARMTVLRGMTIIEGRNFEALQWVNRSGNPMSQSEKDEFRRLLRGDPDG